MFSGRAGLGHFPPDNLHGHASTPPGQQETVEGDDGADGDQPTSSAYATEHGQNSQQRRGQGENGMPLLPPRHRRRTNARRKAGICCLSKDFELVQLILLVIG